MQLLTAQEIINGGILRQVPLSARFDGMLLSPHIQLAEVRFLRETLTKDLYSTMVAQKERVGIYNSDLATPQAAFDVAELETLYAGYVIKLVSYATVYQSLPYIAAQISSNGIMATNTDFAQNLGLDGARFLRDDLLQNIELLQKECKDFLCDNKSTYATYGFDEKVYCSECDEDGKNVLKKFGIILPRKIRYNKDGYDERHYN